MLSFFPRDVLDEILDLIESVSEGFPIYSYVCFDGGRSNRVSHVMHFKDKEDVKLKTYRTINPYQQIHKVAPIMNYSRNVKKS